MKQLLQEIVDWSVVDQKKKLRTRLKIKKRKKICFLVMFKMIIRKPSHFSETKVFSIQKAIKTRSIFR